MEESTTKTETKIAVGESSKAANELESDEIVLYDECGDSLWDRVLRQEENKLKISAAAIIKS
jgi:hypothetical protein